MSKEERIQEIRELEIADRLGISLGYLKDPFTTAISAEAAMKIWNALVAAETKLEPQTVAETIDYQAEAKSLFLTIGIPGGVTRWLKSFVQRHSSAPDTKGLETALEQIATRQVPNSANPSVNCPCFSCVQSLAESALTSYRERK